MEAITIGSVLVALGSIGGVYWTFAKIKKGFMEDIRKETQDAIGKAHALAQSDLKDFKEQVSLVERSIEAMDDKFQREVNHIKETYNGEIRNLGSKIEELRSEVRGHHNQLIGLLTELIKDR